MRELADGLELPRGDVRRLSWAGRLHDLGKVSIDAAALRKFTFVSHVGSAVFDQRSIPPFG